MKAADIKRGTKVTLFKEVDKRAIGDGYDAEFRHAEQDVCLAVYSATLFESFDELAFNTQFIAAFEVGHMIYTFTGILKEKLRTPNMVVIEQISKIKSFNRRKSERDELLFKVNIYNLPPDKLTESNFESLATQPLLSDTTFDISSGGMCIITNSLLKSRFEPHFLVELSISAKDRFLLPAKLVRSLKHHRAVIGKYDYGFQFLFDHLPGVKTRLTSAIMTKKLSSPI